MNKEQREFLVTRVEKYNKEIDELKGDIGAQTYMIGLGLIVLIWSSVMISIREPIPMVIGGLSAIASAWFDVAVMRDMITSICDKAGLSNRINEIEEKLELDELDTGKGMGR